MYSILPAFVSLLFLGYGAYVLGSRGMSRAAITFALVCLTTFTWQFAWAILFQVTDEAVATLIAQAGYVMILFLPTTLYHFVVELTRQQSEMGIVRASYVLAAAMAVALFTSDWIIAGVHPMFFGFYPDAGHCTPCTYCKPAPWSRAPPWCCGGSSAWQYRPNACGCATAWPAC